jgi:hypothetical protein
VSFGGRNDNKFHLGSISPEIPIDLAGSQKTHERFQAFLTKDQWTNNNFLPKLRGLRPGKIELMENWKNGLRGSNSQKKPTTGEMPASYEPSRNSAT